jgi:predicted nuclease with TOPRIM domain
MEDILIPLGGITMVGVLGVTLLRTIRSVVHRYLDRKAALEDSTEGEHALRAELDDLRAYVEALDERLDFTERLLAERREKELPGRVE